MASLISAQYLSGQSHLVQWFDSFSWSKFSSQLSRRKSVEKLETLKSIFLPSIFAEKRPSCGFLFSSSLHGRRDFNSCNPAAWIRLATQDWYFKSHQTLNLIWLWSFMCSMCTSEAFPSVHIWDGWQHFCNSASSLFLVSIFPKVEVSLLKISISSKFWSGSVSSSVELVDSRKSFVSSMDFYNLFRWLRKSYKAYSIYSL